MESNLHRPRNTTLGHVGGRMQRRLSDLAYRLRPDQPPEGLAYTEIAGSARHAFFSPGMPIEIAVWNTFKGHRERYYDILTARTAGADLILLQEFRHDPALEESHQAMFAGR